MHASMAATSFLGDWYGQAGENARNLKLPKVFLDSGSKAPDPFFAGTFTA